MSFARLSKTSYYNKALKLKEVYVKFSKNICSFGAVLFSLREIVLDSDEPNSTSVKKVTI
jgi:hypothetical protein